MSLDTLIHAWKGIIAINVAITEVYHVVNCKIVAWKIVSQIGKMSFDKMSLVKLSLCWEIVIWQIVLVKWPFCKIVVL